MPGAQKTSYDWLKPYIWFVVVFASIVLALMIFTACSPSVFAQLTPAPTQVFPKGFVVGTNNTVETAGSVRWDPVTSALSVYNGASWVGIGSGSGSGFPLTSSVSAAWYDMDDLGWARGSNLAFRTGTFSNSLTSRGTLNVAGQSTMSNKLTVTGGGVDVTGNSTFRNDVLVKGDLTVEDTLYSVTTVNVSTNVYVGTTTNFVATTVYSTNAVYQYTHVVTNITTTNSVFYDYYVNVGGTFDASLSSWVAFPGLWFTNGSGATATGNWDFSGATVSGISSGTFDYNSLTNTPSLGTIAPMGTGDFLRVDYADAIGLGLDWSGGKLVATGTNAVTEADVEPIVTNILAGVTGPWLTSTGTATQAGTGWHMGNGWGLFRADNGAISTRIPDGSKGYGNALGGRAVALLPVGSLSPNLTASGLESIAIGFNSIASGHRSIAIGPAASAPGEFAVFIGTGHTAYGTASARQSLIIATKAWAGQEATTSGNSGMASIILQAGGKTGISGSGFVALPGPTTGGLNTLIGGSYVYIHNADRSTLITGWGSSISNATRATILNGSDTRIDGLTNAFLVGRSMKASHSGVVMFGDETATTAESTAENQATFRMGGGVRFMSLGDSYASWTTNSATLATYVYTNHANVTPVAGATIDYHFSYEGTGVVTRFIMREDGTAFQMTSHDEEGREIDRSVNVYGGTVLTTYKNPRRVVMEELPSSRDWGTDEQARYAREQATHSNWVARGEARTAEIAAWNALSQEEKDLAPEAPEPFTEQEPAVTPPRTAPAAIATYASFLESPPDNRQIIDGDLEITGSEYGVIFQDHDSGHKFLVKVIEGEIVGIQISASPEVSLERRMQLIEAKRQEIRDKKAEATDMRAELNALKERVGRAEKDIRDAKEKVK